MSTPTREPERGGRLLPPPKPIHTEPAPTDASLRPAPPPAPPQTRPRELLWVVFGIIVAVVGYNLLYDIVAAMSWLALLAGAGALIVLALLGASAWLARSLGWPVVFHIPGALFRCFWRQRESADLAAARRAAGQDGRITRVDSLLIWSATAEPCEQAVQQTFAAAWAEVAKITSVKPPAKVPWRVFCFEQPEQAMRYHGVRPTAETLIPQVHAYNMLRGHGVVLCPTHRAWLEHASPMAHHLALELAERFGQEATGARLPFWAERGLGRMVSQSLYPAPMAAGETARFLRAVGARDGRLNGEAMQAMTAGRWEALRQPTSSLRDFDTAMAFVLQAWMLWRDLAAREPAGLRQWCRWLQEGSDAQQAFEMAFHMPLDTALGMVLAEVDGAPPAACDAPPAVVREHIERNLLPRIEGRVGEPRDRRVALICYGLNGYPWRAGALVQVLEDDADPLHAEARWALENLAGEVEAHTVDDWRRWLASLPAAVWGG